MKKARLRLTSTDYKVLNEICKKITDIADKAGIKRSGIIPLPTRKLVIPVRKSPCGGGTETYEKWQLRIHRRIIDIQADDKLLRRILRMEFPENVKLEIEFLE